jgi:hypothetical protein
LPFGDVGPVDFWALRRFARIWAWVVIFLPPAKLVDSE